MARLSPILCLTRPWPCLKAGWFHGKVRRETVSPFLGKEKVERGISDLGGGFKYFLFSSLIGEMIQFD